MGYFVDQAGKIMEERKKKKTSEKGSKKDVLQKLEVNSWEKNPAYKKLRNYLVVGTK